MPERLHYTLRDQTGSRHSTVDYLDIAFDISRLEERRVMVVWIGVSMVLAVLITNDLYQDSSFSDRPFFFYALALIGAAFLLAYFWKIKLILLRAGDEMLMVLHDSQSKAILDEIDKFRKARFLELLGKRDFAEDEGKRHKLIAWLLEKQVINEHEAGALQTDLKTWRVDTGNQVH